MPTPYTRVKQLLFGRPLPSERLDHERLNKKTALAVLSSDAISSVAYATEQTSSSSPSSAPRRWGTSFRSRR